ncbi:hypothetical protein [Candidatus Solirubrobacter pratensis]|uniref:hypothetical protein n=1 Tax=Candidatus Solirubrobacter pratensis TaxID=1298857 RepID=UPI0004192C0F|nr:hypothetical protein [Candidatus Solirubrobacter pratensis]
MASHLSELWRNDTSDISDAMRGHDLPPTMLEASAHEGVAGFLPPLNAIAKPEPN